MNCRYFYDMCSNQIKSDQFTFATRSFPWLPPVPGDRGSGGGAVGPPDRRHHPPPPRTKALPFPPPPPPAVVRGKVIRGPWPNEVVLYKCKLIVNCINVNSPLGSCRGFHLIPDREIAKLLPLTKIERKSRNCCHPSEL